MEGGVGLLKARRTLHTSMWNSCVVCVCPGQCRCQGLEVTHQGANHVCPEDLDDVYYIRKRIHN